LASSDLSRGARRDTVSDAGMMKYSTILFLLAATGACKTDAGSSVRAQETSDEPAGKLAGVWPKDFQCSSIAAPAALSQLLGGDVKQAENPMQMPKGISAPCVYDVVRDNLVEQWQFDFDCRDNYKTAYDTLVQQYRKQNLEMIADWDHKSDAGLFKPNDAGIEYHRPGDPIEVEVGSKALDHHGTALIFLDDDAPCYVRVAGKDTARRLELAKLVAKNLTFQNAPMTPRPSK
jgi:hypothetical protein